VLQYDYRTEINLGGSGQLWSPRCGLVGVKFRPRLVT
jgi:hypothetical protein